MRYLEKATFIFFILIIVSLFGCNSNISLYNIPDGIIGNSNGNIHEGGYVVSDGEWIYYSDVGNTGYLYKKRTGSNEKKCLNRNLSYNLNLVGNWIFYIEGNPGPIFRISTNGNQNENISNINCQNLIVIGTSIFFRAAEGKFGSLYKMDLNGDNCVKLKEDIVEFSVFDNIIYYSSSNKLYKMDFEGENIVKLCDFDASSINVEKDYIVFTNNSDDNKIYKINTDGTNLEILSRNECWNLNLYNGYIYYRNQSKKGSLYRMKVNGSGNMKIIDGNCSDINIINNQIIFALVSGDNGYYITDIYGDNTKRWSD